jgi:hypothetical protein
VFPDEAERLQARLTMEVQERYQALKQLADPTVVCQEEASA